jgi:hypothetical protein
MSDGVSVLRNQIGKATLAVLSALLIALLTWGGSKLWASKLDVEDYNSHLAKDALHDQLDSVWHAQQAAKMDEVLCAVKPRRTGCER